MKRRLFNLLTALSLLLRVAVCVLAVRSYFACDSVAWEHYPDFNDTGRAAVEGRLTAAGAVSSNGRFELWWISVGYWRRTASRDPSSLRSSG